jgi:L-asparaginase
MEETAYLLDLLLPAGPPIVITGAMRNSGLPGADGAANLTAAVQVAVSPLAHGLGVLVVMNDEVHAARFLRKTHSSSPASFRSPQLGPIGWITEGRVRIPLIPREATANVTLPKGAALPDVGLVRMSLGDDGRLIDAGAAGGYAGLVVEAFGAGPVSEPVRDAMHRASGNIPVIFASRTGAGELYERSASYPGSERDLLDSGIISAGWHDGLKARLLLSVLLASGADRPAIRAAFTGP